MRSEVTGFTADNFETEYWFQKKYIEEHVDKVWANGKPTFQSKEAAEMIVFYEGMLEYYGLPLVLPVENKTFMELLFPEEWKRKKLILDQFKVNFINNT